MKTFLILVAVLIAGFTTVSAAWNKIYDGDARIQWFNLYSSGAMIVATGYILDNNGPVYEGKILTSTDGGKSWNLNSYPNTFIKDVCFKNTNEGFIGGFGIFANSYIYSTSNGGINLNISFQDGAFAGINQIKMVNENIGFATGYGIDQFESANCYRTTDGGSTWISQSGNIPGKTFEKSFFKDENIGYAISDIVTENNYLYKTTDAGVTWNEVPLNGPRADGAFFWDKDNFILVGDGGRMDISHDGGKTFTQLTSNTIENLRGISFYKQLGFAVGENGAVIKSTDGGSTWTKEEVGTTVNLNNISFSGGGEAFIYGEGNTILSQMSIQKPVNLETDSTLLHFTANKPGMQESKILTLKNNSTKTIEISAMEITNNIGGAFTIDNFTSPTSISAGESKSITVTYKSNEYGTSNSTLLINSNADNSPINIALSGITEKPTGTISSGVSQINFDTTDVNETTNGQVLIKNTGLKNLSINEINVSGDNDGVFKINNAPGLPKILKTNESMWVSLTFTPIDIKRDYSAVLHIISDDQDLPDLMINVNGTSSSVNSVNGQNDENAKIEFLDGENCIYINFSNNSNSVVKIIDLYGNELFYKTFNSDKYNISTEFLTSGVYFVQLVKSGKTYLKKIIVNK